MSKTKNPGGTAKWKKRRAEILAVRDRCEWCGLTQDQSLEKYGKGLSMDHIRGRGFGLALWLRVAWELYEKQPGAEPRKSIREPKAFKEFKKSHKAQIESEYKRQKADALERYRELTDEDIQVLCSRCHAQKTRGFRLCPKCKEGYYNPRYDACYECNREKIEERRREREREAKEQQEADAELDKHHRDFNYGVEHPERQHEKLWNCGECGEPIDFDHFCNYECCDICLARLEPEAERDGYEQET